MLLTFITFSVPFFLQKPYRFKKSEVENVNFTEYIIIPNINYKLKAEHLFQLNLLVLSNKDFFQIKVAATGLS